MVGAVSDYIVHVSASVTSSWRQGPCFSSHVDIHRDSHRQSRRRGFGATGRDRMGGSLAMDKGKGWVAIVLGDVEGAECNTDWKASLARHTWSILYAALYHASESVSASCPYGMVAIWF